MRPRRGSRRLLTVLCLLAATAGGVRAQTDAGETLRLLPGDVVRLQVADEPELGGEYPVTEEGLALLPLVGLIRVTGRPFGEVRDEIVAAFQRRAVDTQVLVSPLLRIAVLGEVRQPGLIPVDPTFTVADVIAAAGGVGPAGNPAHITLIGAEGAVHFSLAGDPAFLARRLRPGEQIIVARRSWLRENSGAVLGATTTVLTALVTALLLR